MTKKLYIGNLPFSAQESALRTLLSQDGRKVVSVTLLMDQFTGRSKGYGFAEMATDLDAQKAIQALQGVDFMGRPLTLRAAHQSDERSPSKSKKR